MGKNCFNDNEGVLTINGLNALTKLSFESAFNHFRSLQLSNLPELTEFVIKDHCFQGDNEKLLIENMPKLQSIVIHDISFTQCHDLCIQNNPSLQSVVCSYYCFWNKPGTFTLKNNKSLHSVTVADNTMTYYKVDWKGS